MTPVTSAPTWPSAGEPGTKFGIAIGIGWNSFGSSRSRCAKADCDPNIANVDPVAIMKRRRVKHLVSLIGFFAFKFETQSMSFRPKVIGIYFQLSYCCFGRNA